MKEKIILAPGINGNELIKSLALYNANYINLKIMGASELARYSLLMAGVAISEEFISSDEECALVAKAVADEEYFGKPTYSDIRQISLAIKNMRMLVKENDEASAIIDSLSKGIFKNKNKALTNVYEKYMKELADNSLLDGISLIRKAISEGAKIDADFLCLDECQLNPLEKSLLEKVSGYSFKQVSLNDLYKTDESSVNIESFKNCYGSPNEVETILDDVYENKKLDSCTVAVTDIATYAQLFYDYALLYDIPVTFGCGIPIMNSNPAKLLNLYYHWITDGFFGADAINAMINSSSYDKAKFIKLLPEIEEGFSWNVFYSVLGKIRFTNNKVINEERLKAFSDALEEEIQLASENEDKAYEELIQKRQCIPFLKVAAEEFGLPVEVFISKYSRIRFGENSNKDKLIKQLDLSAVSHIYEQLKVIAKAGIEQTTEDIISNIMESSICKQASKAGALHVTGINSALGSIRENLYIVGMSASKFPGSPSENYLLLDEDLKLFGNESYYMTSEGKIKSKIDLLNNLVNIASSVGSNIYVSYAGMNVAELKKDNASSLVFELFKKQYGDNVTSKELDEKIIEIDYFKPAISVSRGVGDAFNKGMEICKNKEDESGDIITSVNLDRAYSPSALNTFFGCPRQFMLGNVLGIPQPDDIDPFEIMDVREGGTLAHSMMEKLANKDISKADFLKMSSDAFDRFIAQNTPLITESVEGIKDTFLEMMDIAYEMDPHREVALAEEDIYCEHETGVKIHGYPDRVEKLSDGSYLIVDFKSSRSVKHIEDDINTCLQVVIYAYLMESKGYKISGGEFRYIRLGEVVTCKYDDDMKVQLSEKLEEFKTFMETAHFPLPDFDEEGAEEVCKYCKFEGICGKAKKGGDE